MDIEIVSRNDNKLLDRLEVKAVIGFSAQTPNRKDIRAGIGGKIAANPENLVLREVMNEFGSKRVKVLAHVYKDAETLKKGEPNYVLVRDGLAEKKAKKKKERLTKAYTKPGKLCPKCGAGVRLAEHANRRSCGKCGYFEKK